MDELALDGCDRLDRASDGSGPQPVIANERKILTFLAKHGIERLALADSLDRADATVDAREIEDSVEGHDYRLAVRRPVVIHDALKADRALALALHLLGFGHGLAGAELLGIDQHRPLARLAVERPQVVSLEVIGPVAQQRQIPPIGRKLGRPRNGAVQ